jgi:outer membrane protein assembly factor BamB
MKVQCPCGAKYAIDVTPEMARDPVRFVCPGCGVDLSGPINDLVRHELGLGQAAAPEAPVATAPVAAAPAPSARKRVETTSLHAPAHATPGKLSIARSAATATHGTAIATAPEPGGEAADALPCPKHQGEVAVERCFVCRKPICPKCMELFGYVCSPLCRAKASSHGINVPVYAGQKSVAEAKQWRKVGMISAIAAAAIVLFLGVWIWYAWFATVPHPVFSVRFPEMAYAGSSRMTGKNQIIFLHGGVLARYDLGSKKATWTTEIITKQQMDAEVDRQMSQYKAELDRAILHGADSEDRPRVPLRENLIKEVQEEMETSLQLFVQDQNIWVARNGKVTRYDWDTGKPGQEVALPSSYERPKVDGGELLFTDENAFGQHIITHLSLASGEMHSEQIGEPTSSAVLAMAKQPRPRAAGGRNNSSGAGLPKVPGADSDKPLDPGKVARDAQNLPYAAKIALPATLSNARHQEQILNEIKQDEAQGNPTAPVTDWQKTAAQFGRSFVDSKYGYVEWSSKVLEQKSVAIAAMKGKPTRSALESNPSVTNTTAIANEILNDMQRERGGDTITEDQSRYQVTVHLPDAKDVPDWVGEVIGPPSVFSLKTVTVVAGGKMLVVLDKSNKKLWQVDLTYKLGSGGGIENDDPSEPYLGEGPCVEHDGALYVFDEATLTAFDLTSGNVRWRVPTIGIVGLFFDDQGTVYVNSTTADLESIKFSRQIDISKKTDAAVLRVDCKTGKVLWHTYPGGFVSHVEGKFVFCFASHQAPDLDPDSLTTLPGMLNSAVDIRRLNAKDGKLTWDYAERRAPLSVRFKGNIVELVFRKEVEVLKFLSF